MSRMTSLERAARLLAIIPWVASRDGVPIEEICERFDIPRSRLETDLQLLWFVGTPPYSPADLIEMDIEDDLVYIRYAQPFPDRLRLTPQQALSLLAAGQSMQMLAGDDSAGPLARALSKLAAVLGVDGRIAVHLGPVSSGLLDQLREAAEQGRVLELDYYSMARDERNMRVVEPMRLFIEQGTWYLRAGCRLAGDDRTFRVDRIHRAIETGETVSVEPSGATGPLSAVPPIGSGRRVVLEVQPEGLTFLEDVASELLEERSDGSKVLSIVVVADAWLERLLLRMGSSARMLDGPPELAERAALRILRRYREPNSQSF